MATASVVVAGVVAAILPAAPLAADTAFTDPQGRLPLTESDPAVGFSDLAFVRWANPLRAVRRLPTPTTRHCQTIAGW